MNTNTLNLIERSLTRLLAQAQATQGPTSADESETISLKIAQAVVILNQECEAMLAKAKASLDHMTNPVGKMIFRNIRLALTTFSVSQPYSSLSNDNKMIVLERAKREYETYHDILRILDHTDPWGTYKRKTYNTLVTFLTVEYRRLSKL